MKKPKQEQQETVPLEYHEEREQQFVKKKSHKKEDYQRREQLKDLEEDKYWN
jgi:hypothetical protein